MRYDKLVRDRIPEIIKARGGVPVLRVADGAEYWKKLVEKLREEVEEFAKDQNQEELADILEVIAAICRHKNFNPAAIELLRIKKAEERGGFERKLILEETT